MGLSVTVYSRPRQALTSSDVGALLAKDDNLCAHGFASLLDSKVTFLVDIDYGDGGVHATSSRYSGDDGSSDHYSVKK